MVSAELKLDEPINVMSGDLRIQNQEYRTKNTEHRIQTQNKHVSRNCKGRRYCISHSISFTRISLQNKPHKSIKPTPTNSTNHKTNNPHQPNKRTHLIPREICHIP